MCRNALHRQKVKKRKGSQNSIQAKSSQKTWKHMHCLFSSHQHVTSLFQPITGSFFFHSVKAYNPSNYIDWEKKQSWPIYNTVNSPLFQTLSSYTLYVVIGPMVTPLPIITSTGKRGESQINPFNYLLAMLVRGQGENNSEPPVQLV